MTVAIHFYSISKDIAGISERTLRVPEHSTLGDAIDELMQEIPSLQKIRNSCLFAIGTNYAPMEAALHESDVISIIPPMQGG